MDEGKFSGMAHLAVVAVDKQGMVLAIQDESKDRLHCLDGNFLLLRTLHVNHDMSDAVVWHEWLVAIW
jgi:hypothetical protein